MPGPWEKYGATAAQDNGKPWEKYGATAAPESPVPVTPEPGPLEQARNIAAPTVRGALDVAGLPGDIAHAGVTGLTKLTQGYDKLRGLQPVPDNGPSVDAPMTGDWLKAKAEKSGILPPPSANPSLAERGIEHASSFLLGGGPKVLSTAGRELPGLAREAGAAIADIPAIRTLRGTELPAAKEAATTAARGAVEKAATVEEGNAQWNALHEKALEAHRGNLEQHLAELQKAPESVANLDQQGNTLRGAFTGSMESAKAARKAVADPAFAAVYEKAAAREAAGQRVDTSAIEKDLVAMRKEAEGIPALESKLNDMLTAVAGKPKVAPPTGPRVNEFGEIGAAPPRVAPAPTGKTFEQLELTRRYLNDVAYSGELEGFPAIVRSKARDTAQSIDAAMQKFVPEFGEYKAQYKTMSEPLESLNTRLGKAISSTEGGLSEGAYSKVAAADLPKRLFAKKEGIDLLTDALAGGKNASVEARATATKQVDTMVENWLLKSVDANKFKSPEMEAALTAAPKVAERVGARFNTIADLEKNTKALSEQAKGVAQRTAASKEVAAGLRKDIELGDTLTKSSSVLEQTAGYNAYRNAITRAYKQSGLLSKEEYAAAQHLFDRAATLEEKTALARKLLAKLGVAGGLVAGEEATRKLLF